MQQSAFVHPMFWRIRVDTLPTQIISADGANVIVKASGKVYLPIQESTDVRMAGMPSDVRSFLLITRGVVFIDIKRFPYYVGTLSTS